MVGHRQKNAIRLDFNRKEALGFIPLEWWLSSRAAMLYSVKPGQ